MAALLSDVYPKDFVAYSNSNVPWHLCVVGMRQTEVRHGKIVSDHRDTGNCHAHCAVKRGDGYSAAIAKYP